MLHTYVYVYIYIYVCIYIIYLYRRLLNLWVYREKRCKKNPEGKKPEARTGRQSGRYGPWQRTHRETLPISLSSALRRERKSGFAQEANKEAPMPHRQAVWFLPCKNQIAFVCMAVRIFLSWGYSILVTNESNCLWAYGNEAEPSRALRWERRIGLAREADTQAPRPRRRAVWFLLCKNQIAFVHVVVRIFSCSGYCHCVRAYSHINCHGSKASAHVFLVMKKQISTQRESTMWHPPKAHFSQLATHQPRKHRSAQIRL